MLYILLSCVLTLSQMFPTIFKPREIHNFSQGNGPFHLVACQWRHTPSTKEYTRTRCMRRRCGCLLQWPLPKSIYIQDNTLAALLLSVMMASTKE